MTLVKTTLKKSSMPKNCSILFSTHEEWLKHFPYILTSRSTTHICVFFHTEQKLVQTRPCKSCRSYWRYRRALPYLTRYAYSTVMSPKPKSTWIQGIIIMLPLYQCIVVSLCQLQNQIPYKEKNFVRSYWQEEPDWRQWCKSCSTWVSTNNCQLHTSLFSLGWISEAGIL